MAEKKKYSDFVGFVVVGVLTVLVNLLVFKIALLIGMGLHAATFFGNLTSILVNFAGLLRVFKSQKRFIIFLKYLGSWLTYYFVTIWLLMVLIKFEIDPVASRVIVIGVLTPLNYFAQKFIIYKS